VDTSKVSPGEMIAGISALALFIFMFLPWYSIDAVGGFGVGDFGGDLSAWEAFDFVDILLLIATIVVVGLVLARAAEAMPDLPQPPGVILAAAGGIALVLVLFRLIVTPDLDAGAIDVDVDLGRKIGIFLGLIAAAGIAFGGWRALNEGPATAAGQGPGAPSSSPPWEQSTPSTPASPSPPPAGGGATTAPPAGEPPAGEPPPAGGPPPQT
jgi:hypothetical protein